MRYEFADFTRNDQPLINKLRAEGKHVYHLRDNGQGNDWTVEERVYVNNIGFVVTDTKMELPMGYEKFVSMGEEVHDLVWEVSA